ncbi:MAG: DUF3866 family protein, partial [Geodermatophilaceae bacterium]
MIRWRSGVVQSIRREWRGAVELAVDVDGSWMQALAYLDVVGRPEPGDEVLLNTTAVALGLGTGGYAMVVAVPARPAPDPEGPGHLVKARYTPTQTLVFGADEQDSPHHALLSRAESVDGMPVVVADLHSALPAIVAGVLCDRPAARIAYLMTDGAALPLAFSRTVAAMSALLTGTITSGQAYGGNLEAVTIHSGLLMARHVLDADLAIVTQGPGNLGTGTPWGFSGVQAGDAANAASTLGARVVGALRISAADPRERHRGVSHHSTTAFGRVALGGLTLVVPDGLDAELAANVRADLAGQPERNQVVTIPVDGLAAALRKFPVPLSTMGRGLAQDQPYFLAAAAAGR